MRAVTLSGSNHIVPHHNIRKQNIGLPAFLSLSFSIWFGNCKQLKRERVNKLIMAGEMRQSGLYGWMSGPDYQGIRTTEGKIHCIGNIQNISRSLAGITGSNPTGRMDVCLL